MAQEQILEVQITKLEGNAGYVVIAAGRPGILCLSLAAVSKMLYQLFERKKALSTTEKQHVVDLLKRFGDPGKKNEGQKRAN